VVTQNLAGLGLSSGNMAALEDWSDDWNRSSTSAAAARHFRSGSAAVEDSNCRVEAEAPAATVCHPHIH
jgi:hypothetical protein